MNLLEETIEDLEHSGHKVSEVLWVGSRDGAYALSWDEFSKLADVDYDNDYGSINVIRDLVVVGNEWWLERYEYDGAEQWIYKRTPILREGAKPFIRVLSSGCYNICTNESGGGFNGV